MSERLIRDGKTAIIYSPGFGAGWSSWGDEDHAEFLLHDREMCEAIERKDFDAARTRCKAVMGEKVPYFGGLHDCKLGWVPTGSLFYIHECDGNEWIVTDFRIA